MKKIVFALLLIVIPTIVNAMVFTATTTGNWESGATWGNAGNTKGVDYPNNTDTFVINKGVTVTINTSTSTAGGTIGANAGGGTGNAVLVLGTGVVFTVNGIVNQGNGASADGQLTFGAGSELAIASSVTWYYNNGAMRSNATSGNWAKVTGLGSITANTTIYSGLPKQDTVLSYVSFQCSGTSTRTGGFMNHSVSFNSSSTTSGYSGNTNQLVVSNCTFVNMVGVYLGVSVPISSVHTIANCDFIDTNVAVSGGSGTASANYWIKDSTFYSTLTSTTRELRLQGKSGLLFQGNYVDGYGMSQTTAYGITFRYNVWTGTTGLTSSTGQVNLVQSGVSHIFDQNYIYANWTNPHELIVTGSGSTLTTISNNVFESYWEVADNANFICFTTAGASLMEVSGNILRGKGNLAGYFGIASNGLGNTLLLRNNTIYTDATSNIGSLWIDEGGFIFTGSLIFQNNLIQTFNNNLANGSYNFNSSPIQALIARGNAYYNVNTAYNNFNVTQTSPDLFNPGKGLYPNSNLTDPSRSFITWNANGAFTPSTKTGNTDTTDGSLNAKIYLRLLNGYNSTTKVQISANAVSQKPSDLVTWVRAGYSPRTSALTGTGYNDGTNTTNIGAITPIPDTIPPTVTFSAVTPSVDQKTVTVAFAATDNVGVTGYSIVGTDDPTHCSTISTSALTFTPSAPTSYTQFTTFGKKYLCAWAKDVEDNISTTINSGNVNEISVTLTSSTDSTAPTVSAFTVASSSVTGLNVGVTFTATDNVAVTGYLITESSTVPTCSDPLWQTTPYLNGYTTPNAGVKTLYPWAKDAKCNISTLFGSPRSVTFTDTDSIKPVVTNTFAVSNVTNLTANTIVFTATDNIGVTGYAITESSTPPAYNATGVWTSTAPTFYTASGTGNKTLYPWAKDAANNVSDAYGSPPVVSFSTGGDSTAPNVTVFTIPATATSLDVPITTITATDAVGVTGYMVTTTNVAPDKNSSNWSASVPPTARASTYGSVTLYAWAKDAAGNVSNSRSATTTITFIDTTPPQILTLSIPASASAPQAIPITIGATDNVLLTDYMIIDTPKGATAPVVTNNTLGWIPITPAASSFEKGTVSVPTPLYYTFTDTGDRTLWIWFRDSASPSNISAAASANITITRTLKLSDLDALYAAIMDTPLAESYALKGQPITLRQAIYQLIQMYEKSIIGTDMIIYGLDGTTPKLYYKLDNSTAPKSVRRVAP